ncbi:DUF1636 domain-containing protein [Ruegeria sp. HKCCD4884]|uniref:DUF1636 family protein n=1 Tax=Ruegeria sp. HKCCD4884 TaxID=2683022 RepID=UPI0014928282|nr:DUF1636 domain-containing protein [Ruegeria sp. HKCCD4884]NOD94610.1 DUF1636 domain-containing protein [Ruegeria sp. HKCCD4884]
MTKTADHFILVCATCSGAMSTDQVTGALAPILPEGFAIRTVDCMAGCSRPTTIGLQAPGKAQYLFGDIDTELDLDAVAEFAGQYRLSSDGWTSATERPPALFTKTLSRIPALPTERVS